MKAGDIGLTGAKSQGAISRLIKLGALVARYPKAARQFSHAFLILDSDGNIAEAVAGGVEYSNVSKYDDWTHVETNVDVHDARQVLDFAHSVVSEQTGYGKATFAACGINCLLGHFRRTPVYFGRAHTAICSGFVADALTRAGYIWPKPCQVMMPADLWLYFHPNG